MGLLLDDCRWCCMADYGLVRAAGWADLGLVERRTVQNGEGTELPAIAARGHQGSGWRGLGEERVAVGEGRYRSPRGAHGRPRARRGSAHPIHRHGRRGCAPGVPLHELRAGNRLLLCTDGLTSGVDDAALGELLSGACDVYRASRALVDAARAGGATDDISVIAVECGTGGGGALTLLSSGDRITDTLVVDRLLGEGAFAEVHRVEHEYLGWQAMKLFKKVASLSETRTMLGEARLLSTMGHPNIVRLFDANTVQTPEGLRGFFTMEYIAGGSLDRLATSHRPAVPVDIAVEVTEQIASGLAIAHDQSPPIVHRDLTLANVLVGYDGTGMRVRISDFGLAKRADPFTLLASAQGTYAFMAPEVLRDEGYSCASDVWSVGTIAYLLLTNHFPYDDGSPFSSYSVARFRRPLLAPSRYNDDVDAELDRTVLATLEVDPGQRPATARVLADALRERREAIERIGGRGLVRLDTSLTEPPTEPARHLADEALVLARHPSTLNQAADLMEEAVNLSPRLHELHLPRLTLWRRGLMM